MPNKTTEQIRSQHNNMSQQSNNISEPFYAVYSLTQENFGKRMKTWHEGKTERRQVRYNIYQKADGTNVKITEVNRDPNYPNLHKTRFEDSVYVGRVVKWIETVYW
jgi:hypothetical protein